MTFTSTLVPAGVGFIAGAATATYLWVWWSR